MSQFPYYFVPQRPPASPIIPLPFFYSPPPSTSCFCFRNHFVPLPSPSYFVPVTLPPIMLFSSSSHQLSRTLGPLPDHLVLPFRPVPPPHIWLSTGQVLLESLELSIGKYHPTLEQQGPEKSNFVKQSSELEVHS